ncbi:MAG: hypothetical protein E3J72_17280 [Planctomycetota bacterium]|nr:MAG: hypothetical protein E3J72_17280 [Planctomycetota bacterium]
MSSGNDKDSITPFPNDGDQDAFAQPVGAPVVPAFMPAPVEAKPPALSLWPPGGLRVFLAALLFANLFFIAAWNIGALFARFSTETDLMSRPEPDRAAIKVLGSSAKYSFPSDDAWIHFQFARNLARHGELAFNHGISSTGTTAPLWTFLLAIGQLIFGDSPAACFWYANVMNFIFFYLALLFIVALSKKVFGSEIVGWFAAFFTVNECHMSWALLSGMEISLFMLLMFAAFTFFAYNRFLLAGLAAGLCFDTRPIALIIIAILAADLALRPLLAGGEAGQWKKLARMCGAWLIATAPILILFLVISGSPLPNTFDAKTSFYRTFHTTGPFLRSVFFHFSNDFFRYIAPFAVALAVEMFVISVVRKRRHRAFPLLIFFILFIAAFAVTLPATFQRARYIQPMFPLAIMFMTAGVVTFLAGRSFTVTIITVPLVIVAFLFFPVPQGERVIFVFRNIKGMSLLGVAIVAWLATIDAASERFLPPRKPLSLASAAGALRGAMLGALFRRVTLFFRTYHAAAVRCIVSGVILVGSMAAFVAWGLDHAGFYVADCSCITDQHIVVGKWLDENTEPDSVIAAHDIGAVAYFSRRRVLDLIGLVDPAMISYARVDHKVAIVVADKPTGEYIASVVTSREDRAYLFRDPEAAAGAAAQIAAEAPERTIEVIVYDVPKDDNTAKTGLSVLRNTSQLKQVQLLLIVDDLSHRIRAKWGWARPGGFVVRSRLIHDFKRLTDSHTRGRRHHRARRLLLGEDKRSREIIGRYSGGEKDSIDYFAGYHNRGAGFFEDIVHYTPPGERNRFVHKFSTPPVGRSVFGVYAVKPAIAGDTDRSKSRVKAGEGR